MKRRTKREINLVIEARELVDYFRKILERYGPESFLKEAVKVMLEEFYKHEKYICKECSKEVDQTDIAVFLGSKLYSSEYICVPCADSNNLPYKSNN